MQLQPSSCTALATVGQRDVTAASPKRVAIQQRCQQPLPCVPDPAWSPTGTLQGGTGTGCILGTGSWCKASGRVAASAISQPSKACGS